MGQTMSYNMCGVSFCNLKTGRMQKYSSSVLVQALVTLTSHLLPIKATSFLIIFASVLLTSCNSYLFISALVTHVENRVHSLFRFHMGFWGGFVKRSRSELQRNRSMSWSLFRMLISIHWQLNLESGTNVYRINFFLLVGYTRT